MSESFRPTEKQRDLFRLIAGPAKHIMAFGGSRSAKTFAFLRAIAFRALAAEGSRHVVLRFRLSHLKGSVIADTWPKMLRLCYPEAKFDLDKQDLNGRFSNGSEVWFGGLDDKDRTEKILGQEHATIFLNECSQIPFASRNIAVTRLAQLAHHDVGARRRVLRLKMFYDCNPPLKTHWTYQVFISKQDPDSRQPLRDPHNYAALQMNPRDNAENLPADYFAQLDGLPARMRVRFRDGEFGDAAEGALWTPESIERWREADTPDLQRIVIGIDPSGSGDVDNAGNDEIGIIVAGLGTDGSAYVLEDLSIKAGPEKWGGVAVGAYDRHDADMIVGEVNFGGEMVRFVVQAAGSKPERGAKPRPQFKKVTASRGKVVRAEPISVLTEQGKVRFAGNFPELEDELCGFTTGGYTGSGSPNRADAMIWAMSELFPGMVKHQRGATDEGKPSQRERSSIIGPQSWMA